MFILEAGKNHFGKVAEANRILKFFKSSSFTMLTFMCQSKLWYEKKLKLKKNFKLPEKFYTDIIKTVHRKNKKIGLSVCDADTFNELKNINFDFYKLLSIGINNNKLINQLKKTNKPIYISTGYNASIKKIEKCLKSFKNYKKLVLLHTPMVTDYNRLNFRRILLLRKKFKLEVGYSNHFNDVKTLYQLVTYDPKVIMLYIKTSRSNKINYPDNKHAINLNDLESLKKDYENIKKCHI